MIRNRNVLGHRKEPTPQRFASITRNWMLSFQDVIFELTLSFQRALLSAPFTQRLPVLTAKQRVERF